MKLVPRASQIIGRMVQRRSSRMIVKPDQTKDTTKLILIDAVGAKAAAAGFKVGDVVVPLKVNLLMFDGDIWPGADEEHIAYSLAEFNLSDFLVQTSNGTEYVPFDSERAARPLGLAAHQNGASETLGAPV